MFPEAPLTDLPAIARQEVATGLGGPVRTALAGLRSPQRWGGSRPAEIAPSYRELEEAVEPLREHLLTRLGYTADGAGALRPWTDVHLGRVIDGTTHPVVGVGVLGWYSTWVNDRVGTFGPVAEAEQLAERWVTTPSQRPDTIEQIPAVAMVTVETGRGDLVNRPV